MTNKTRNYLIVLSFIVMLGLLLVAPMIVKACPEIPQCTVRYNHTHQVVVVQPQRQFDLIDMVESMVYISGGVERVAGSYYSIRGMGYNDDFQRMWNKRYKYGLDTRPNTEYGVQSYDRRYYGGGYGYRRPVRHPRKPIHHRRW